MQLSVFDENFTIVADIEDEHILDMALSISNYKNGRAASLSPAAEQVMFLYDRPLRKNFTELMLFVDAPIPVIAKANGVSEDVIAEFKALFFNTDKILGQLGKTEYYEDIFMQYAPGTPEYERASMFRQAHLGGPDVILQQFNVELDEYNVSAYKDRVSKYNVWNHKRASRGDLDVNIESYSEITKATDAALGVLKKTADKSDENKVSDLEALTDILSRMNSEGLVPKETEVRQFDTTTEDVIDVPAIENKTEGEN